MKNMDNERKRHTIPALGDTVLDLVFPKSLYCICCGNMIDSSRTYNLCDHCVRHIRWDTGPPEVKEFRTGSEVADTQIEERDLERLTVIRCTEYGIYERTLIFSLKYGGNKYIAKDIAQMMKDKLDLAGVFFDVCVPIPLFEKKKKKRGFNHAALIARHIADLRGVEIAEDALKRIRDTRPMRGLGPSERAANIRGSIDLGRPSDVAKVRGRRILLVDDFFTTGNTAFECLKTLQKAEPKSVIFMAFAAR